MVKHLTYMEMVDLSYSKEYREYVADYWFGHHLPRNEITIDRLVKDLEGFGDFINKYAYRLKF